MSAVSLIGFLVGTTFLFGPVKCDGLERLYTDIYAKLAKDNVQKIAPGILDPADKEVMVGLAFSRIPCVDVDEESVESIVYNSPVKCDGLERLYTDIYAKLAKDNVQKIAPGILDPADKEVMVGLAFSRIPCVDVDEESVESIVYNRLDQIQYFGEYPAVVYSSGTVFRIPVLKVKFSCNANDAKNHLSCAFKLGSWVYNGKEVNPVFGRYKSVGLLDYFENRQWELTNATAVRVDTNYSCCPETYPSINYFFELERRKTCL